jgi:hypothetical protein
LVLNVVVVALLVELLVFQAVDQPVLNVVVVDLVVFQAVVQFVVVE